MFTFEKCEGPTLLPEPSYIDEGRPLVTGQSTNHSSQDISSNEFRLILAFSSRNTFEQGRVLIRVQIASVLLSSDESKARRRFSNLRQQFAPGWPSWPPIILFSSFSFVCAAAPIRAGKSSNLKSKLPINSIQLTNLGHQRWMSRRVDRSRGPTSKTSDHRN